jgi:hypothetical protein
MTSCSGRIQVMRVIDVCKIWNMIQTQWLDTEMTHVHMWVCGCVGVSGPDKIAISINVWVYANDGSYDHRLNVRI